MTKNRTAHVVAPSLLIPPALHPRQSPPRQQRVRVLLAQRLPPDRQRPPHQWNRIVNPLLRKVEHGKVVEALGGGGMVRAKGGFSDGQRPLEERQGGTVVALGVVQGGQIIEAEGGGGMVRAKGGFMNGQRPLEER